MPSFERFFVLHDGPALFRIPALEAIVFLGAAEEQVLEQLLSVGTQEKIGEEKPCVRPWSVGVNCRATCVGNDQIHRYPSDRRATLSGNIGGAVKLAWRRENFTGGDELSKSAARHHMHAYILLFYFFDEAIALGSHHGADNTRPGVIPG